MAKRYQLFDPGKRLFPMTVARGIVAAFAIIAVSGAFMTRPVYAREPSMVFLNPGAANDIGVWGMASAFMRAVAADLGVGLEILYADRDHLKMVDQARQVAARAVQPDYVIMVNEKRMGARMLRAFETSSAKSLLIHADLTEDQRHEVGGERERIPNWIGTVVADERLIGYRVIEALYRQCRCDPKVLAISGEQATPVSALREQGLLDYMAEIKRGQLLQVVHGHWSRSDGRERAAGLLVRYPEANVIWAANDSMAEGAYDAAMELGRETSVAVGGLGGFPDALASIARGGLKTSVGGAITTGGMAIVLLYDHYHGHDFASTLGTNIKLDSAVVISDAATARRYGNVVIDDPDRIDFRKLSLAANTGRKTYDFSFQALAAAAK